MRKAIMFGDGLEPSTPPYHELLRQLVASDGNGFCSFRRIPRRSDLPLIATGCNHGAP
jgi:hypothetical protein